MSWPKTWPKKTVSRLFLRVSQNEWPEVSRGIKNEFRAPAGLNMAYSRGKVETPTPVVLWKASKYGEHEARLMVLLEYWEETLGGISPESLAAEGCESMDQFRKQWRRQKRVPFNPMVTVRVYRLRPWEPGDESLVFDRLYPKDMFPR